MKRSLLVSVGLAVAACALVVAQSASAFIIDSFNVSTREEVISSGVPVSHVSTGSGVIGTYRDIMVDSYSSDEVLAKILVNSTVLNFDEPVTGTGLMTLTYDGDSSSGNLNLGNNIAKLSSTYVTLRINADKSGSSLMLQMWEAGSTPTLHSWGAQTAIAGSHDYRFSYADVGLSSGQDISAIRLTWDQGTALAGADASFRWFGEGDPEVPEPGTMALMAALMGLGGLGVVIRRRVTGGK